MGKKVLLYGREKLFCFLASNTRGHTGQDRLVTIIFHAVACIRKQGEAHMRDYKLLSLLLFKIFWC